MLALNVKDKVDFAHFGKPTTFRLLNPACTPPIQQSIETIHSIDITAKSILKISSLSIHSGDTITSLFLTKLTSGGNFESIRQFTNKRQTLKYEYPLLIKFDSKPESPSEFVFDILVTLSDNSLHKFDNQKLKIK